METAKAKGASSLAVTQHQILPGSTASDFENWNFLCLPHARPILVDCLSHLPATVLNCQSERQEAERYLCPACSLPGGSPNATDYVRRRGGESWASEDTRYVCKVFGGGNRINILLIMILCKIAFKFQ